jgi:hypothetical protein
MTLDSNVLFLLVRSLLLETLGNKKTRVQHNINFTSAYYLGNWHLIWGIGESQLTSPFTNVKKVRQVV